MNWSEKIKNFPKSMVSTIFFLLLLVSATASKAENCTADAVPSITITSPRNNDFVHSNTVVISSHILHVNGTHESLNGVEVCISYALGNTDLENILTSQGCLMASGPHIEITIPTESPTTQVSLVASAKSTSSRVHFQIKKPSKTPRFLTSTELRTQPERLIQEQLVLVMAHWNEDISWINSQPFPTIIYEKNAKNYDPVSPLHFVPRNVANEASAFLKFIVDYYDTLPAATLFLLASLRVPPGGPAHPAPAHQTKN